MKNQPTFKIGDAVVFAGFDGGSYSATITDARTVGPRKDQWVRLTYFPAGPTPVRTMLVPEDWHRLTLFGDAKFLAI